MICPTCDATITVLWKRTYCPECREPLNGPAPSMPEEPREADGPVMTLVLDFTGKKSRFSFALLDPGEFEPVADFGEIRFQAGSSRRL